MGRPPGALVIRLWHIAHFGRFGARAGAAAALGVAVFGRKVPGTWAWERPLVAGPACSTAWSAGAAGLGAAAEVWSMVARVPGAPVTLVKASGSSTVFA